ncbi:C4-dicarboxylate ABC transporter [Brevirhabdus pacifica]|uniref:C4-dicarboxylate ABC transporter n=1 Tax=Brevirhabdus pacifica TaxID=1267768 RepID=A0A1U7DEK9_9RHOB|nr:TRAP transporter substrate-binding protein [Brevirhabdus pacifica]APX88450.1 C4-dicarboxylate ABC transporter [Brevirhabdus pacifica]OWU79757.1 C4-dicarboxylate ABC transporter [Loktanella sp. 22II-4b]PJJ87081.1 tripartite ATP-independent transporter DctP family solute receptor [Brevirhabdus pacifica]
MKLSQYLSGAALAAIIAVPGITPVAAAEMTLKFGHVGAPGSLYEETVNAYAECANSALGDKAEVQVFGSSQLGKDKELLQKLKLGQVDFSLPSSIMSSVDDVFGIFEMPYIIKDRDHMRRVQGAMMDKFQEAANKNGYRIVGLVENGFRHITNNVRPVNKPEDLKGIKLRTPNGAWRVKMFKEYGANPTPMAFADVFTALQTGVIDGQENPYAQIASAKFQEVQKYLSITGHVYTPAYILASEKSFAKLPEDVQATLTDCGSKAQDFAYKRAAELETELLQVIKDAGVEVNDADKDAFIEASKPIYEAFGSEVEGGQDMIDEVLGLGKSS